MRLKVAVIGGDKRSVLLCSLLWQDRHRVHSFALERAELPAEIPKAGCLQGCLYGADCVVLPTPAEKNGLINAPYAAQPLPVEELLSALWPGQLLIGGKLSRELCMGAVAQGLIWGLMAIGVYITFKVLDLADLTVDGTMCTGGAVCIMLMTHGVNVWVALLCAFVAGLLAGAMTYAGALFFLRDAAACAPGYVPAGTVQSPLYFILICGVYLAVTLLASAAAVRIDEWREKRAAAKNGCNPGAKKV